MNPAMNERLSEIAREAERLGHGLKTGYLKTQAEALGMSYATLQRKLAAVVARPTRKRRADAGKSALSYEDAQMISALVVEAMRKNGKRLMTVGAAVEMLRANGKIDACRVDKETGEVLPLSESTIIRALREYKLHPDQLLQPDPVCRLKSAYPNHWWQIDPSLCVLYYLPKSGKDTGLRVAGYEEFYKNKPQNVKKIELDRVWRYTGTDHASGTIVVRYYFGGETSANLCDFFIYMMQAKAEIGKDPIRGVPANVMLDPGSANTSSAFKTLCKALGVHVQINKPGNPRAKGQVEKANDMVETAFESSLKLVNVANIDELNHLAERWMRHFNSTKIHSRHGMTRYQAWNTIKPEQLILPPPADYCRELAISTPKEAKVSPDLEIRAFGKHYSVKDIQGVLVGQKLLVAKNPWDEQSARVATWDSEGNEVWVAVPEVVFTDYGFRENAAMLGEEYHASADTPAQIARKAQEKQVMGVATLAEAEAKRKSKALPFNGEIDPFKQQEADLAARNTLYMPRQGQQMDYNRMEVAQVLLNKIELAKLLKPRFEATGKTWGREQMAWLTRHYPDGITESELETVFEKLMAQGRLKLHKTGTGGL